MVYENILLGFEDEGRIARITLNRPEKLNSLVSGMAHELMDALGQVRQQEARVVLLTGAGRAFCAGADLSNFDANFVAGEVRPVVDIGMLMDRDYNPLMNALHAIEIPVICAVNGVAAGAGASIAMLGDIVIAARSASFIQAFGKLGLMSDCGATYMLPRLVGTARALGLALLGEPLPAEQAAQWGLIWRCVDDADLMAEAEKLAKRLSIAPTRALMETRQAIHLAAHNSFGQQLRHERNRQRELGFEHDFLEGIAAFKQKRKPEFTASGKEQQSAGTTTHSLPESTHLPSLTSK